MRTETGQTFRLEDYKPTPYAITDVSLVFRLTPENTSVIARLTVERRDGTTVETPLVLDGDELSLTGLTIDGLPAAKSAYDVSPVRLEIHQLPVQKRFDIQIKTELAPQHNTELMGLYRTNGVYCTQCEPEGFRRITYFLDRPDILSVYSVRIEARRNEAQFLLSNGNPGATGKLANGWHFAEWTDPHPKPSYLFALVAGNLGAVEDSFKTASGRQVDLRVFVEPGKEKRAAYAMDALKRSMRWDEDVFGLEYDLDIFNIVAVSDFNMGAMENKGLNVFNDKYVLADEQTATDADFASIEAIVAHEYFHNWTGNRITCRDWFQLCLKEGLTVFRDHEFSADQRSRAVKRITEVRALRANQFPEDRGPLAHPVRPTRYREINNFYTSTVYEKGAEVVRMLRTILGPEKFREGMDRYFASFDGTAATIEDFIGSFAAVTDIDLTQFFLWYKQAGTPNLAVSRRYDAKRHTLTLEIEQSVMATPGQTRKKPLHIPVVFGLVGADGNDMAYDKVAGAMVTGNVIHIKNRQHRIVFSGVAERPVVSLLREFSAPVTLNFEQRPGDEAFLARHDSDLFARWQALYGLTNKTLIASAKDTRGKKEPKFPSSLVALMGEVASDDSLEPAYRGLALTLPSEAEIARELGENIDPDCILSARDAFTSAIANRNHTIFESVYQLMAGHSAFQPDAESAGRRALKNTLLNYLACHDNGPDRVSAAYFDATNMTDRAAAMMVITHRFPELDTAQKVLADFETRYRSDPVVLDKWFTVQAITPGPAGLANVKKLVKHPAYSARNPNRFRALIGAFATANHTGFNLPGGEGYRFVAEQILMVEGLNPQVAARLATAFRSYSALEPVRREHARSALVSIARHGSLSADLRDIVDRLLT